MTPDDTDEQDTRLADLLSRIERFSAEPEPAPAPLTGRLADLRVWWSSVSGGSELIPARVTASSAPGGDCLGALLLGAADVDRAVDSGATLAIPQLSKRDDLTALTVIALLTRREANRVVDQPEGMSDAQWMHRCAAVRDRTAHAAAHLGDHLALLDALDATDVAATAGMLLGAAARRTPCLIVGTGEWAAALVADRMSHVARTWWRPATTSPDPAQQVAAERIGLDPLIPLDLTDEAGLGAEAVIALLRVTESAGS